MLVLFLLNRLLAPLGWLVDLPMAAAIFLNFNRLPGRWSAFLTLGLLMDLTTGSPGVFLAAWSCLCLGLYLITGELSLSNQLGRWLLTGGAVAAYILLVFFLSLAASWLGGAGFYQLLIKLSFWQTAIYLLLNSLIIALAGQFFYQAKKGEYVEIA